jgi:electron transport complex protein RnfD
MPDNNAIPLTSSPFVPSTSAVARVMRTVIYALVPGILIYIGLFGWSVLINILIATASALLFEWAMLLLRQRPVRAFLLDGSAIITAILLSLAIPPLAPWWLLVLGSFFSIVVAKHLYGGLGYNTFNPAMAAYAVLLVSFPLEMSMWSAPVNEARYALDLIESIQYAFFQVLPQDVKFDALTSATVLDHIRTEVSSGKSLQDMGASAVFGYMAGQGFEWVNLGFLLGGLWLIYKKIISWHIPLAVLAGLTVPSLLSFATNPDAFASPLVHLLGGASILGAFFIATDPVTASTTPLGRLIYGAGIGFLTFAIRSWGGYPDGMAFAVLLMGMTVPLLDYYTAPKVYGERSQ